MIVADEGKHIRQKDDIYVPEHTDGEGNIIPEHIPYYTTTIFLKCSFIREFTMVPQSPHDSIGIILAYNKFQ